MRDAVFDALSWSPLHGLTEPCALADLLGLSVTQMHRIARATSNYVLFERHTGGKARHVAAPRGKLDQIHRDLVRLLMVSPPDYLHSGTLRRSHVTNAACHRGQSWLCKIDLRSFYLQLTASRVRRFFVDRMRCSASIAAVLTRLCTIDGHLPTGGRISQPLAFLLAWPMFEELDRLARSMEIRFSVYVDDLCFSGNKATPSFLWYAKQVIHRHGFQYHAAECYHPNQPRLVTGVLLRGAGMAVTNQEARRIRLALSVLDSADRSALLALQGRLAAASSIDPRCSGPLQAVRARLLLA